jgi:hypothetical protein
MRRWVLAWFVVVTACIGGTGEPAPSPSSLAPLPPTPPPEGSLTLVGHDALFGRGMNAALAVLGDHVYIGSRTDGSGGHPHPGVLVLDIHDPSHPRTVGEIGSPFEGDPGETSRELRVWPAQQLLLVLNFPCDPIGHDCASRSAAPTIRFYDIAGSAADHPALVSTYRPSHMPHEFFLWQDPDDDDRALLFMSTPFHATHTLLVTDISGARQGRFKEVSFWGSDFPEGGVADNLHSLSVSPDGSIGYIAHLTNGFFMVDTSEVARGVPHPHIYPLTPLDHRLTWEGWGAHSAIPIPGRDLVLTTDEVYGSHEPNGGCPWGWARIIDVADPTAPRIMSEYRVLPYDDPAWCASVPEDVDRLASFSSHDPTATEHLAFVDWHSAGVQVFSTADPAHPVQVAEYVPEPLDHVATEDPILTSGPEKVAMWSYPVIQDGLIYVVDIRNGLYVLRYEGPYQKEVDAIGFLEGNSNLGDAMP